MTLEQIRKFIGETEEQQRRWKDIVVLGGEPTLHPQFLEIMELLVAYKRRSAPATRLMVKSNGKGGRTVELLSKLPPEVIVENSEKKENLQSHFDSFNVAPSDLPEYAGADYTNGCRICAKFGVGLTRAGYYPCAVAGGIDRVMGFDIGKKSLPSADDGMTKQMGSLCRYCGHFKRQRAKPEELREMSPCWRNAYRRYRSG